MKAYNHIAYSESKEHRLNLPEINFKAMTTRKEDNSNYKPETKKYGKFLFNRILKQHLERNNEKRNRKI